MRKSLPLFLLAVLTCHAQTSDPAAEHKETVIVTGSWAPVPLNESDRSVNTYPVAGETALFGNLSDVFAQDPSVNIQSRGTNGIQADFSLRGASFEQTLLLVNGVRMSDEQSAHYNSDFAIPLDDIDHVEILRGAGSTLYGSDAVGGVINIITHPKTEDPVSLVLRGDYGSFHTNEESGFLSFLLGPVSERLSFERELASGFIDDREYRNFAAASDTYVRTSLGLTRVLLGYDDRPFGADQFYGHFNSWERTKAWLATLSQDFGQNTSFSLGYRRNADLFVLLRDNPSFYTNRHVNDEWDVALRRKDALFSWANIYYGAELTADHVDSSNLGSHSRKQGAVYGALDARALRRASLSIGAREEFYGANQTIFVPNVSGGYWLSSQVKLRASASRAFRLPNYTDLYYSDPGNHGNPNLKPEHAASYEAGVDWQAGARLRVSATGFERREHDGIDYVRTNADTIWQATNFDRINFVGVEAQATVSLAQSQTVSVGYTALHGAQSALGGYQSKYVFNYPTEQAVLTWQRLSANGLTARVRTGITNQYGRNAYVLVDASAGWTRSRFHPYARVTNAANADYQTVYGVPMPDRAITGGLEVALLEHSR